MILRGADILRPNTKADGQPDKGKLWPMPDPGVMSAAFRSYEKDAFAGHPEARNAMYQASLAIYAAKSSDAGDATGVLNQNRWEESVRLATGGIERHNGKATVLPYGYQYGQFKDALARRIDQIVDSGRLAEGVTRDRLRDMPLDPIGDGRYVLRAGDGILVDKDSRPVVVDFNVSLPWVPSGQDIPSISEPSAAELDTAGSAVTGRSARPRRTTPKSADPK